VEIRVFKDKGYAFIRYDNKESACNAIVALNSTEMAGSIVRCSWGKEGGGMPSAGATGGFYDPSGFSNGGMAYDASGWQHQQGPYYPPHPQQHGYYPPGPGYGYPGPQMPAGFMYGQYPGGFGGYGAPPRPPH
jgi:nucleolysin TIA-1/TIAR